MCSQSLVSQNVKTDFFKCRKALLDAHVSTSNSKKTKNLSLSSFLFNYSIFISNRNNIKYSINVS